MASTSATVKLFLSVVLALITFLTETEATYCRTTTKSFWNTLDFSYTYCPYGCCGNFKHNICCSFPISIIIGIVAGGCVLVAVIVTVVCCCCCCRKHYGTTGTVIHTGSGVPVVVQSGMSSSSTSYIQPPMYPQTAYSPNAYPPNSEQEMMAPKGYAQPPPAYNDINTENTSVSPPAYHNPGFS